jgi:formylglycine-generating enzyme required for sulfatase activity
VCGGVARGEVDPVSGIDFVTVGAVGNRGYDGPDPFNLTRGRGAVGYTYNIGRMEVTSAQWAEFLTAVNARVTPLSLPTGTRISTPVSWGGRADPTYTGPGTRYIATGDELVPVGGINWRASAIYCNWLHNGKSTDPSAFFTGAYDVSTFSASDFPTFTDQATRSPNAKYWIPSLDEWMKAVHYDPNKNNGDGTFGGWWEQPNGTNIPLTYGPPLGFPGGNIANQANAGFDLPNGGDQFIPLGSYPSVTTPWGLLDAAGATTEWTESIRVIPGFGMTRIADGSAFGRGTLSADSASLYGDFSPRATIGLLGLRVATVPAPGVGLTAVGSFWYLVLRRRRGSAPRCERRCHESVPNSSFGGGSGAGCEPARNTRR